MPVGSQTQLVSLCCAEVVLFVLLIARTTFAWFQTWGQIH